MDIRYAAGFFDGEGCLRIDKFFVKASETRPKAYQRYQLKTFVAQANPAPLIQMQELYGGKITSDNQARNKDIINRTRHIWLLWSKHAYDFLKLVRPHLIVKADEADLAISFFEEMESNRTHFRVHRGMPPNKAEIHASRDLIIEKLYQLKRMNYSTINSGPMPASES